MSRLSKHIALIVCYLATYTSSFAQVDSIINLQNQLVQTETYHDSLTISSVPFSVDSVINFAFSFKGKRYKRGGTTVNGFDCSGFTMIVYKKFGVKLPHSSAAQGLIGIIIPKKQIEKGDLILFRGRNSRRKGIGHVGIVISKKGEPIQFIHSSTSSGVRVDYLDSPYYKNRYVKAVRVRPLKL